MSEFKFTTDGKKVAVIGAINSTQFIVQEIFVTPQGDEIPSGEKFVTTSLHDERLETRKDKTIARLKAEIERLEVDKQEVNSEINRLYKLKNQERKKLDSLISSVNATSANADLSKVMEHASKVLSGDFKVVLKESYNFVGEVLEGKEAVKYLDSIGSLGLTNSRKGVGFVQFVYDDGSGSHSRYIGFENMEELREYVQESIDKRASIKNINFRRLKEIERAGYTIDPELRKAVIEEAKDDATKKREAIQKDIDGWDSELEKINKY